jgi:hypothetical protein
MKRYRYERSQERRTATHLRLCFCCIHKSATYTMASWQQRCLARKMTTMALPRMGEDDHGAMGRRWLPSTYQHHSSRLLQHGNCDVIRHSETLGVAPRAPQSEVQFITEFDCDFTGFLYLGPFCVHCSDMCDCDCDCVFGSLGGWDSGSTSVSMGVPPSVESVDDERGASATEPGAIQAPEVCSRAAVK